MQIYFHRKVNVSMYQWKKESVPPLCKIIQPTGVPNQTPFPALNFFLSATLVRIYGRHFNIYRRGCVGNSTTHTSSYIVCGPDYFFVYFMGWIGIWNLVCDYWLTGSQKHTNWSLVVSHFQGIEQLKKEERRWAKKTKWMNMRAVFGHPFSLLWFSPFSTPDQGKAETYQYVVWELSPAYRAQLCCSQWWTRLTLYLPPTLAMDSFPPAFCFPFKCAIHLFFVLPWVSWVAEKKKALSVCESCLKTLW